MLRSSGVEEGEIPGLLQRFKDNVRDLEWTIQADVEYFDRVMEK